MCLQFSGGEYPIQPTGGGVPHPRSRWGGRGRYPIPGPGGGVPHPRSRGCPVQLTGRGIPHPADGGEGLPIQLTGGYPVPGPGEVVPKPHSRQGVPHPGLDGHPPISPVQDWMGYHPVQTWDGQGVKHSYFSYFFLFFSLNSYFLLFFSLNSYFSYFFSDFKVKSGYGYVSQLHVRGMASLQIIYHPVEAEYKGQMSLEGSY